VPWPTSPPGWFFVAFAAMAALHVAAPGPRWVAFPATLLGVPLIAAGVALHWWALAVFARALTTPDPEGRPRLLVRSGPYARTRNPMYLAGVPILAGVGLVLGTTTPALVLPLYALGAARWVAAEEARLTERFGLEWEAYRTTVPRWL
jgi:protein-S-isoprenylcysteine O-methyltransferase Ste14